jgi:2-polyprenyl-6-hydroxyphenyl methylase/3-demethylubiquinone-9 3-methyltransferase
MTAGPSTAGNVDPAELARFAALAADWWDPDGPSRTLHDINGCRSAFIAARAAPAGRRVLDVGCGGGLLSEALAAQGAKVTGIDAAPPLIEAARAHAVTTGLAIEYVATTAEAHEAAVPAAYDIVVCMELLEHVPDPAALVHALGRLVRPGGDVFLSTLNRTPRAYLQAVLAAEYVLRLLPKGTHDYRQFVRPAELARYLRAAGLSVREIRGMRYAPWSRAARLEDVPGVNYLVHARRD